MKALDLWWSRELRRIADITETSLHLLDDSSLEKVAGWAMKVVEQVDAELLRRSEITVGGEPCRVDAG